MYGCKSVNWDAVPHYLKCCSFLFFADQWCVHAKLSVHFFVHTPTSYWLVSIPQHMSQHEDDFQGVLLLPCFLHLPICEAAFVLFSKETHLDWFNSIFMYKLSFLAILSVIWESLLSISPFRSFFQLPSYYTDFISSVLFFSRSSPDWLQQNC